MSDDRLAEVRLDGVTVLFAHPSGELYGSDRVLIESVQGVLGAGGRAVVALPVGGPLVDVLTAIGGEVRLLETPVLRKSMLSPAGLFGLVRSLGPGFRAGRALVKELGPDLVYVNTVTIPLWIAVGFLSRRPVLSHIHEAEGSASRAVNFALNLPLLLASRVIANSSYSVAVLSRVFPRLASRTQVVYNGVAGPAAPSASRLTLDGGLRILYVGRLSDRKGVDVAISALGILRERGSEASLEIVGAVFPGYEWYEQQLRGQINELGLAEWVQLRGFESDIWPRVAHSDVVVVPSRYDEPFGNTAVEAVLAARAVVVSDTSGLREAARGYRSSRTVRPGDPVALADSLEGIVEAWAIVREDASADRLSALERHSPDLYRQRIAHVTLELL
ncbi:glycosyltransferase [Subtercola boreus]|uniref:glycosyltransferase n=1 Tax=Subtercola boreus TaxID=120213 RepID=UPI001173714F|nr:glycosyltransferase [Subtercola boreus]TQL54508.1 glycosyl transferase family 4 [Subtercola boreus]